MKGSREHKHAGWVAAALASGALAGGVDTPKASSSPEGDKIAMADRSVRDVRGSFEATRDTRRVKFNGKNYEWSKFDNLVRDAYKTIIGDYADDCLDAETCYYAFGDQMGAKTESVEALTGKSRTELEWTAGVFRNGFFKKTGVGSRDAGTIAGVARIGGRVLSSDHYPPFPTARRRNFFNQLYRTTRDLVHRAWKDIGVSKKSDPERRAFEDVLATVIEASVRFGVMLETVVYQHERGKDFDEWYQKGVGGVRPGRDKLQAAFEAYCVSLKRLEEVDRNPAVRGFIDDQIAQAKTELGAVDEQFAMR